MTCPAEPISMKKEPMINSHIARSCFGPRKRTLPTKKRMLPKETLKKTF
jgi:hypothetical protein